jgi:hypothetical protein
MQTSHEKGRNMEEISLMSERKHAVTCDPKCVSEPLIRGRSRINAFYDALLTR